MFLTKRQKEVYDYLQAYIRKHGYAPTFQEIGRRFELSSLATVHKHLSNLETKGLIKRHWNYSRAIELLAVKGDSMIGDGILDGDYIVVEERLDAEDGAMVVATVAGEATVKRLHREKGGMIRLQPANDSVPPILAKARDVTIRGVVVAVMRKY